MKIKVYSSEIEKGMFVSELDRPWLGTPFLLQGFLVRSDTEISQLQSYCQYVYVDEDRSEHEPGALLSTSTALRRPDFSRLDGKRPAPVAPDRDVSLKVTYREFSRHLAQSKITQVQTRKYIDQALEDMRLGAGVDTENARRLVGKLAEQVVESPDALVWLTHLKRRDDYTATHCINVAVLSLAFGRFLGLGREALYTLGLGALLHDLGKMRVPAEILNKPGRLTDEEFQVVREHPDLGHQLLLKSRDLPQTALDIVLLHHERIDGRGYPKGMSGDALHRLTKIVSIVDVYDAVTSDRVYHDGIAPATALKNLYDWAPNNFDLGLVEAFIRCIGIYPIGSLVQLNTGEVGVVVASSETHRLRPIVRLMLDEDQKPYGQHRMVNLSSPVWDDERQGPRIVTVLEPGSFGLDTRDIIEEEVRHALSGRAADTIAEV
jgi:HD-GYP domain-containing protein (c-di-GMP phosphodiesterase class II)